MPKVTVWPAAKSVKLMVLVSGLVNVPLRVCTCKVWPCGLAAMTVLLAVPATARLVTSPVVVVLVNTTVLPWAALGAKPVMVVDAAKKLATVAAVAPPAGAV